jgi:hypothetical protein
VGKTIETVTNVVMIAVALLVAGMLVVRNHQTPVASNETRAYAKGDKLREIGDFDFNKYARTVVLVIRSDCQFCTRSMGFYRTLVERRNQKAPNVGIIVVTTDDVVTGRDYLAAYQLRPDGLFSVRREALPISGTPFIILADSGGKVLETWLGQLSKEKEANVINIALESSA